MTTTTKAMRIHAWGGPTSLTQDGAPLPRLASEDVLVAVHAAAVNPVDWKVREGHLKELLAYQVPLIPGWDFSGQVVDIGTNVARFAPGDEVFGRADIGRDGTYSEYLAVSQRELALKPRSIDHVHAAAVPLAALTAWQALLETPLSAERPLSESPVSEIRPTECRQSPSFEDGFGEERGAHLQAGDRVLIHGAAGGVGAFAVQLALWRGAHVIGTGSRHSEKFLQELGVHQFVDYEQQRFESVVEPVDVVLDTVGGDTLRRSWQVLAPGGKLVSIVSPPSTIEARARGVLSAFVLVRGDSQQLAAIGRLIDKGVLRPIVSDVMPLADARRAQLRNQDGHKGGKVVLTVRN